VIGALLVIPSVWVEFSARDFAWWMRGLALVAGAVGIALMWAGMVGLQPDWEEPGEL
jgi:hypothetical protein